MNKEKFLSKKEAAELLGVKVSLLDTKASQGGGPPYFKEKGKNWYRKEDLLVWHQKYKSERKWPFNNQRIVV